MTKEEFVELKNDYMDHIQEYFKKSGDMFAHVAIFAEFKKDTKEGFNNGNFMAAFDEELTALDKPAIIHVTIPDHLLKTNDGKDIFVDFILKEAVDEIKQKCNIVGIAWTAEAWMSVTDKAPKDGETVPVKAEVIIISIESEDVNECNIFEIKRAAMKINDKGELVSEKVELEKSTMSSAKNVGGRFSGLYNKIKD